MNLFEEFRKEAEAACWRVTGKTVEEWDELAEIADSLWEDGYIR